MGRARFPRRATSACVKLQQLHADKCLLLRGSLAISSVPELIFRVPPCSLLYELFTSAAAVEKGAPLLIACNKMDAPGARTVDAVKAILEEEL